MDYEWRETYCVWPDDTKALTCEVAEGLYSDKSDDYAIVSLTDKEYEILSYDEIMASLNKYLVMDA